MQMEARWGSSQLSEAVQCLWFAFFFFFLFFLYIYSIQPRKKKPKPQPNIVFHNNRDKSKKLVHHKTLETYYQFYYATRKATWKLKHHPLFFPPSSECVLAKTGSGT